MSKHFALDSIAPLQIELEAHPVYSALASIEDLQVFMQHHIYSVWDFMSLIKFLQTHLAPTTWPWTPHGNASVRHFINSLVLEEESDIALQVEGEEPAYTSHFELYCQTMREVGTTPDAVLAFVDIVVEKGIDAALDAGIAPAPSEAFMRTSFGFINTGKPHVVAAALALGREHVIPGMFRSFLARMDISEQQAPAFHYYLNRHIHLDEDFHAPLSLKMLDELCAGDPQRMAEAEQAAQDALRARLAFWDGVVAALPSTQAKVQASD
jgi:hypothetical protein